MGPVYSKVLHGTTITLINTVTTITIIKTVIINKIITATIDAIVRHDVIKYGFLLLHVRSALLLPLDCHLFIRNLINSYSGIRTV